MENSTSPFSENLQNYQKARELLVLMTSVNNKALLDLKQKHVQLLENCRWLVQYYYIAHSNRDFTPEELSRPLNGISQLTIANSLRLFSKPNHKDRYSYLMHYLRENSGISAQIIYLTLLTPTNRTLSIPDLQLFSEDDVIYFCFTTFPAIYNFFLTREAQESGIKLIRTLFSIHTSIHGMNFGKPHKFLSYMVTSLFLSSNPGTYFDISVSPLIQKYASEIEETQFLYEKLGNNLVRKIYWTKIVQLANMIIESLTKNAPLMPAAARFLINCISKVDSKNFPFVQLFVIDAMICDYLENRILTNKSDLLHDVCNVIRCKYPQNIIQSPVSSTLQLLNINLNETIKIEEMIQSLTLDTYENDQLTQSIRTLEEMSLFTARDLFLLHSMINLFIKYADESKIPDFIEKFQGLQAPLSSSDDKVICLKSWNPGVNQIKCKVNLKAARDFDDIIDSMSTIDISKKGYKNADDLSSDALLYCTRTNSLIQKLRLSNMKNDFNEQLASAPKTAEGNRQLIKEYGDVLFTSLFSMTFECERGSNEIQKLMGLYLRLKVVPTLDEVNMADFDYLVHNGSNKSQKSVGFYSPNSVFMTENELNSSNPNSEFDFGPILDEIDNQVSRLSFEKQDNINLLKKQLALFLIDQFDKINNWQLSLHKNPESITSWMNWILNTYDKESLTRPLRLTQKVVENVKLISVKQPPSHNIEIIINVNKLIQELEDQQKEFLFLYSGNPDLFSFEEFLRKYVKDSRILSLIFSPEEMKEMKKFIMIIRNVMKK